MFCLDSADSDINLDRVVMGPPVFRTLAGPRRRVKQRPLTEHFFTILCLDSDDSDNEGGLGNMERVVMRLPEHKQGRGED